MQRTTDISNYSDEDLLNVRMCDLELTITTPKIQESIKKLYQELKKYDLPQPICYLSDEWFSPDAIPAIAIPFYLGHSRLEILEQNMMYEVEGGTESECMKLLRHECAHAFVHGFGLSKRVQWTRLFGPVKRPYQDFYRYKPYSKSYVHNLKDWYAQCHPEEDFAETFAVWLDPDSDWKTRYQGWGALKKLQYVDQLMRDLKGKKFRVPVEDLPYQLTSFKRKLSTHYQKRKKLYAEEQEEYFDHDLKNIFSENKKNERDDHAHRYLKKNKRQILNSTSYWTHERKYSVEKLLNKLTTRCQKLKLYICEDENVKINFLTYFVSLVSNYVFTSRYKRK